MKPTSVATLALLLSAASSGACPTTARAEDHPYISVGQAKTKKTVIAFPEILGAPDAAKTVHDTVVSDLQFMDLFKFLDRAAFVEARGTGITADRFKMTDWNSIGAEFVAKAAATREGGNVVLEAYLYDVQGAKQVLAKRYIAAAGDSKTLAHTFANDIVSALTGLPGIFQTKIAMSCERSKGRKEIFVMDYDGTNVRQVTNHRSIAMAPAWSPDGLKLAYSLYNKGRNNVKNLDLFEYDFATNSIRMLSNRKTMNSGAAYSPDGRTIALTMNFLGNPEIFTLTPGAKDVTRLTKSMGFDVDPSWSPDGSKIVFVSTRSGPSMVFSMASDGSNVQRLTFAGKYNATPHWSPRNNKIAFSSWVDGVFDIFIMNPDGTNLERLSKGQGFNEDPHFSPDGNFIAFSSNRTGGSNIYVMNIEGCYVKRLTFGLGNCSSPKWSNPPRH